MAANDGCADIMAANDGCADIMAARTTEVSG